MTVYDFTVETIDGQTRSLRDFEGKVLLIVNTASKCGFTPQYAGLQELYAQYRETGVEVLGFPCNQFGGQEPGSNNEIAEFCTANYQVTFPMFAKIKVNGPDAHPLYEYLKSEQKGILGSTPIKWNFTKFLVDKSGQVTERYAPNTEPAKLREAIEAVL